MNDDRRSSSPMSSPPLRRSGRRPRHHGGQTSACASGSVRADFLSICLPLARDLKSCRDAVIADPNPLNVHALRTAGRRLHAVIGLFDDVLHHKDVDIVKRGLKAMIRCLNRLRDLDVYLTRIEERERVEFAPGTPLQALALGEAISARAAERSNSVASLRAAPLVMLVDGVGGWIHEAAKDIDDERPFAVYAAGVLRRRHGRVIRAGRRISRLSVRQRHALRLRVKKLRFTAEALTQALEQAMTQQYLSALTALSHALGELNDDEVGGQLTKVLTGSPSRDLGWKSRGKKHRKKLAEAWINFEKASTFYIDAEKMVEKAE